MKTFKINSGVRYTETSGFLRMKYYLKNTEWVIFDNDIKAKDRLIFRKDNELLMSTDGKITRYKWEYVKENSSIVIDNGVSSRMLKVISIDKNLVMLCLSEDANEYIFLINSALYSATYINFEWIQFYLIDNCNTDILMPVQRKMHEAKIELERQKLRDEINNEVESDSHDVVSLPVAIMFFSVLLIALLFIMAYAH